MTDGYAVGVTLLVCMTGRPPIALFDELEAEFSCDFDEIPPVEIAQPNAGWPAHAARVVRDLVLTSRCPTPLP